MKKFSLFSVILGMSFLVGGLALHATTAFAAPPDLLETVRGGLSEDRDLPGPAVCVNESDRANVRAARNACDDFATGEGYNVGIFRPYKCHEEPCIYDVSYCHALPGSFALYECLGAPGLGE
jgi:hypothetical protein